MAGPDRCIRSIYYHGIGEPAAPLKGRAILTMDDSSWHEELTLDWFNKSVLTVHSKQMPINIPAKELNIKGYWCNQCRLRVLPEHLHGHIDWISTDPLLRDWLVEHKALSTYQCQRIEKGLIPWDYIVQACIYSAGLQRIQPDLRRLLLVIKNKNSAQYIEFEMEYDVVGDRLRIFRRLISFGDAPAVITTIEEEHSGLVTKAVEKFQQVGELIQKRTEPQRPFEFGTDFPCNYCGWNKICWDGYIQEVSEMTEDAALSDEIAIKAAYYNELGAEESEIKKSRAGIRAELVQNLLATKAQSGLAGDYFLRLSHSTRKKYVDALIPQNAITEETTERLYVKRIKKEEG